MAEAVVSLALQTLTDLLLEEGRFLLGVGGEVKALQTHLQEIKCLLRDADTAQHKSETVRNWMAEIRDLAYRAEDVIAAFAVDQMSSSHGQSIWRLLARFSRCCSLHQLGSEISDIKSEVSRVTTNMKDYGIRSIIDGDHNPNWTRKTFPNFKIEDCFVGNKGDVDRLISLLLDFEKHRVISVWGMGGIGKTTVVKKVYNHFIQRRNDGFDSFAWVCITQQCQIRLVLEDVLKQLLHPQKGKAVSNLCDAQLIEQLCETQRAKRCMIVLDDLWQTSHWNGMKHAFLARDLKSKILVTTRKQKVAEIGFSLQLQLLNMVDACELLNKKAFPLINNTPEFACEEELQRIVREMVGKCGRLPLAISLLGGVLSKKSCMREWELVNENINASIYRGDQGHDETSESQIEGVLNLSYQDLPYYLKPCFLYFGKLREDESIYAPDLYRMWIAQGMILEENMNIEGGDKETLTDIAELYLSELASRCIVQVELEDVIPTQKYRTCKLHDVVRELCLLMGKKENFGVQILEYQGGKFTTLLQGALSRAKTRHLAIHFKREIQVECDELTHTRTSFEEDTSKQLRSLEILSDMRWNAIEFPPQNLVDFRRFKLLRGLVILRFKFVERKLPKGITDLVHLRFLRLRQCELDSLPSSISNLAYLDTLDLHLSKNVRVPNVLKKMSRLKHLLLPLYNNEMGKNYRLKLDEGVDELESLIGFDSSVHELKCVARMKNLRRFTASIHDNESLLDIINTIATKWNKLAYCRVSIKEGCNLTASEQGLRNLKQAFSCPNLYYLRIEAQLGKLLEECRGDIMSSKLVKLAMFDCQIEEDPMGILGKLPLLRELYMDSRSFVGEVMTCRTSSFPGLKKIVVHSLPRWREWRVERGAMPLVSEICIRRCPRLEMIPDGLSEISSLEKLVIGGIPRFRTRVFGTAGREGVDFHKVRHVPSIIIN